jgi:hypothetical protein
MKEKRQLKFAPPASDALRIEASPRIKSFANLPRAHPV